jgi:hypothetical protein
VSTTGLSEEKVNTDFKGLLDSCFSILASGRSPQVSAPAHAKPAMAAHRTFTSAVWSGTIAVVALRGSNFKFVLAEEFYLRSRDRIRRQVK